MSLTVSLVVESTNLIRLLKLKDVLTRLYPTNATVVGTLYAADGVSPVSAASTGIPMPYVAGTTGRATEYRGTLPANVPLVIGATYVLKVTATDTVGDVHVFRKQATAIAG